MLQVKDLVSGRIDFHVHPGPDPFARVLDSYEMAWLAERYGMKAIVFKTSHYQGGCTAQILDSMFTKLHVVGGLCLENAVGGINPRAVEIAIQCGVKVIWMPFLDSTRNMELFSMDRSEMSPGDYSMVHDLAKTRSDQRGKKLNITVDGKLLPEVPEVLRIIAENDAVICSGHMNRRDRAIFVKAAKETGAIVTTEEHNVIGGLGAAVSEVVGETCPVPVVKHGVEDVFGHSGTAEALMIKYGLTPEKIAAKAKEAIALKK